MEEKNIKNSTKPNKVTEAKTFSEEEVNAIVAEAVKKAMASYTPQNATPTQTVLKIEMVTILYIGTFASGTTVALGKMGSITKPGSTLSVSKEVFLQAMGTPVVDALLRNRELIVIDGLTNEERERFNLLYKEGEILDQQAFFKILDYPIDKVVEIFKKLCVEHKVLVAQIYKDAYFEKKNAKLDIDTVKALNKISKETVKTPLFADILEDYGRKFAED